MTLSIKEMIKNYEALEDKARRVIIRWNQIRGHERYIVDQIMFWGDYRLRWKWQDKNNRDLTGYDDVPTEWLDLDDQALMLVMKAHITEEDNKRRAEARQKYLSKITEYETLLKLSKQNLERYDAENGDVEVASQ